MADFYKNGRCNIKLVQSLKRHKDYLLTGNNNNKLNWSDKDLSSYNLEGVDLRLASLLGAKIKNIRNANLYCALIADADLSECDASFANFCVACLDYSNFHGAVLRHAVLRDATLVGADLRNADLNYADFRGAYLGGVKLEGAKIYHADFRGADFGPSDNEFLSPVKIKEAQGWETADFTGAFLDGIDLAEEFGKD